MITENAITAPTEAYTLDKKTGVVTMANGKQFNPYSNEGCEGLTLEELKVYNQERFPEVPADTVEAMAVQYANAAAAAQPFLDTMADIKAKLLEALPIGNHPAGPLIVTIKAGAKVLDTKKLEAVYPQAENPLFYKTAFDTTAVKKFVAPAVLEVYTRQNASSVVIK